MRLEALLSQDRQTRRFSMISLDRDVAENRRFVRRQISEGNLVGGVSLYEPDFEFANFSIEELVELAAQMDEAMGASGAPIREATYSGVKGAKALEEVYKSVSLSGSPLKGERWGRTLGRYGSQNTERKDGSQRPMIRQLYAAMWSWSSNYVSHCKHFTLDLDTFENVSRSKSE